jgi:ectoine hydroxylase-related dioxygenase (phytanoyl-CoA dioxygenase family)
MTFLTAAQAQGGGTIFWPGAHTTLAELGSSLPSDGAMKSVAQACADACEGIAPVEITPDAGDVAFYDIFTPHSGSTNLSTAHRIALNQKWGVVDRNGKGFYNVTTAPP